ncbi:MAG: protein kinase [Deltaproteobacteria bacterium]|nr:protein kinase [Deltaproteobacteria bacterium]
MTQVDPVPVDPLVGQSVAGKYKIVKQLGEGGMGCVYLAEQQLGSTARKVALKTLHKHLSHDPSIKARFDREAGTVAALEHPNTIQVYDFGTMEDGTLYLVMEFVQGRSVADILEKDGAMPPDRVTNIMKQVCGSLEEAHNHGIVHRDLKPDNVVLCEKAGQKDWVEVLDFGIAKRSSEHDPNEAKLTQQGMVLGTPPYMSPEQFTGQPVDLRSDIYALGVMAYEMLTGKYPFEANTAWEWASKHMTEPPRPIEQQPLGPNVPPQQRAAIERALAKNKDERFASVREFFEAFSGGAGMTAALPPMSSNNPQVAQAVDASARPKTEMAQPMVGGPMGGPPMGGPPMGGPPMGAPAHAAPAVVPPGPAHHGASGGEKKGGMGLIIGLGVVAVLLLGGGGVALMMKSKPKPVPTTSLTDLASASAGTGGTVPLESASAGSVPDPGASVTGATPLTSGPTPPTQPIANAGGGSSSGGTTPAKPTNPTTPAKPVPTPIPAPKPRPPECDRAKAAIARNSPAAPGLEAKCRALGGVP